jgi:hypothetical protein
LLATPAFFTLAARGLARIYPGLFRRERYAAGKRSTWRWFYFLVGVFVAVGFVPSLRNYYFDPVYARDDYRTILQFIDSNARAGDGILVDDKGQIDVVRYYWRGNQQLFLLPRMRPPDPAATRADVDAMLGKVRRLFAIYYATEQSDPQGIIETQLAEKAFKARDEWHGNVRLAVYGVAPAARGALNDANLEVGDGLELAGFRVDSHQVGIGDVATLTLYWRAVSILPTRVKVFVHLLDASNQVVAQRDGEPVGDMRPTTTWRAGESLEDNYGVMIAPGTPPGEYAIEIGVYRADNGARLPISLGSENIGDHLILGTVQVEK